VPDFTNVFHTLCTKLGIKYSERHLVLSIMTISIDTSIHKWSFWTSRPWERAIDMMSKASIRLNKRHDSLGLQTPHSRSKEKVAPTCRTKGKARMNNLKTTSLNRKQRRTMGRQRKTPGSSVSSIRALAITSLNVTQSIHWWPR
jgi:hypothetical protein